MVLFAGGLSDVPFRFKVSEVEVSVGYHLGYALGMTPIFLHLQSLYG